MHVYFGIVSQRHIYFLLISSCRSNGQYRNPKTVGAQTRKCLGEDIDIDEFLDEFEKNFFNFYLPAFSALFVLFVLPLTGYRLFSRLKESTERAQEKIDHEITMEKKDVEDRNEELIAVYVKEKKTYKFIGKFFNIIIFIPFVGKKSKIVANSTRRIRTNRIIE